MNQALGAEDIKMNVMALSFEEQSSKHPSFIYPVNVHLSTMYPAGSEHMS